MQSLSLHPTANTDAPADPRLEVERLEATLEERSRELSALQEEFRRFRLRYTQVVGSRLAELAEVEREIKLAERRLLGLEDQSSDEEEEEPDEASTATQASAPFKKTLRGLFWSVARMFHPDHAADEREARRRHSIMAEANRAYREGDVESLHTLLGDEELQSYCVSASAEDDPEDFAARLLHLREELLTIEFGLRRIRQDTLYRLMLTADEEAGQGRDALAAMAQRIERQIVKARHRLAHLA
ncbi:MAG TPA: hypothetical protein VGB73_05615 [Pyrinomonadaceae bacterium]|jgi:hypothetical protein